MHHSRLISTLVILPLLALLVVSPAAAQGDEHGAHHHGAASGDGLGDGLGEVHFAVSCVPAVQPDFDRAVALLHSFEYEGARNAFGDVAKRDPGCAMAHWGEAMTWYHPVWTAVPTPAELASGAASVAAASAPPPKSERERAWIAAVGAFYRDHATVDHRTRALAYRDAMRALMERYPDDTEAAIFYALLGVAPATDPSLAQQKQSAEILNRLLPSQPRHPGIVHYLIHAFDYPPTASLALPAARVYAGLAPQSAHARHMPSHIFTRLGLWEESIASNWSSAEAAQAQIARTRPGTTAFEAMHAYDYLEYAYLKLGQDRKAQEVADVVARAGEQVEGAFQAAYALSAVPARYALERSEWREAAAIPPSTAKIDWKPFAYAEAIVPFANTVGAARAGEVAQAKAALERLVAVQARVNPGPAGSYDWPGQVESLRLAAAGWVARAERRDDEAVSLLTRAAELEERVGKNPVTPGAVLPAREQLGDLLLELDRPAEALTAYEASLAMAPNRYRGLAGAARAAELAGHRERAVELAATLRELCKAPACTRQTAPASVGAGATGRER